MTGQDDQRDADVEHLLNESPVKMETGYDCMIVIDNVPKVPQAKFGKLVTVLEKLCKRVGDLSGENAVYMPFNPDTQMTDGFCFVEFKESGTANAAIDKLDKLQLDRNHIFRVTPYNDFERLESLPNEYITPQPKPFEPKANLKWWVTEGTRAPDQFALRYGDDTEIFWNESDIPPVSAFKRKGWTDTFVSWSPMGTYLATVHQQGIILWGGPNWEQVVRFAHVGVKLLDFSPNETYLVTYSDGYAEHDEKEKNPKSIIIWDVKTGKQMRGFKTTPNTEWPYFKWTHDDKYFARKTKDVISVYGPTPDMGILDKKPFKIPNVQDFAWSPTDYFFSCWIPETNNCPAQVMITEVPSRADKRQKILFNVKDCTMHWNTSGNYLAVKVNRHKKNKKTVFTSFEIFRLREKGIPIEVMEIEDKAELFSWEPKGTRFAIVHSASVGSRNDVSFYDLKKKKVVKMKTLEKRPVNHLSWSPKGSFVVIASLKGAGSLEFFSVDHLETMGQVDHFMSTSVSWDPTGRFICSEASAWHQKLETGYNIWSFSGKLLTKVLKDRFYQFVWRPRPPTLLTKEQQDEIKKNLAVKYVPKYKEQDEDLLNAAKRETRERRAALKKEFEEYLEEKSVELAEQAEAYRKLMGGILTDDESNYEYVEETVEEEISIMEELVEQ